MLKTRLTEMLGIDHPIVLAPMGSATSPAFAAAASNAGALGSIGTLNRPVEMILRDLGAIRGLTSKPFAINHIPSLLMEEAFQASLDLRPAVISFALGDPGDLVTRVHDVGCLAQAQITTVVQANQAAERGVDIIVA
jgi:enoyl-[acyl-carrier protein] reductase II